MSNPEQRSEREKRERRIPLHVRIMVIDMLPERERAAEIAKLRAAVAAGEMPARADGRPSRQSGNPAHGARRPEGP